MRKISILGIITIGILASILALNYMVKAATTGVTVQGYLILMDQKVSANDYAFLGIKDFSTTIYLPTENAEGTVTACGFVFPDGVDEKADVTKDGRIDAADWFIVAQSYGCDNTLACWSQTFNMEQCYFVYSGRRFQDPTRDCIIDQADVDLVNKNYGKTTDPNNYNCDKDEVCRCDINKDGKVDLMDVVTVSALMNQKYPTELVNYATIKKSDADLNGDGKVDLKDVFAEGKNYGYAATVDKCTSYPLQHLTGKQYIVRATIRGLHYVGASYSVMK